MVELSRPLAASLSSSLRSPCGSAIIASFWSGDSTCVGGDRVAPGVGSPGARPGAGPPPGWRWRPRGRHWWRRTNPRATTSPTAMHGTGSQPDPLPPTGPGTVTALATDPRGDHPSEPVEDAGPAAFEVVPERGGPEAALDERHPGPAVLLLEGHLHARVHGRPVRHPHRRGVDQAPRPVDHLEQVRLARWRAPRRPERDRPPPARSSHSDSTTQSGASAYSSFCASGSVNASKTTSGVAS